MRDPWHVRGAERTERQSRFTRFTGCDDMPHTCRKPPADICGWRDGELSSALCGVLCRTTNLPESESTIHLWKVHTVT